MTMTVEAIVNKIEQSFQSVCQVCRNVPTAALIEPTLANGWSVKDTIAHLAAWDWRCAELLGVAHHTDVPLKAHPAVDALNLEIYQERRNWTWKQVELSFREAHEAVIEAIQALPPDRLTDEFVQRSIAEETWEHYEQHIDELRNWHQQVINRNGVLKDKA
jgi:hypothetical protein